MTRAGLAGGPIMTPRSFFKLVLNLLVILLFVQISSGRLYHWGEMTGSGAQVRARESNLRERGISISKAVSTAFGVLGLTTSGELVGWGHGFWCLGQVTSFSGNYDSKNYEFVAEPTVLDCAALVPELSGAVFVDIAMAQSGQIVVQTQANQLWSWGPNQWKPDGVELLTPQSFVLPRRWTDSREPRPNIFVMVGAEKDVVVTFGSGNRLLVPEPYQREAPPSLANPMMWNLFDNYYGGGGDFSIPISFSAQRLGAAYVDQFGQGWWWIATDTQEGDSFPFGWNTGRRIANMDWSGLVQYPEWSSIPNISWLTQGDLIAVKVAENLPDMPYGTVTHFWLRKDGQVIRTDLLLSAGDVASAFVGLPRLVEFPSGYICRSVETYVSMRRFQTYGLVLFVIENTSTRRRETWGFGTNDRFQLLFDQNTPIINTPTNMTWLAGSPFGVSMVPAKLVSRPSTRRMFGWPRGALHAMINLEGQISIWGHVEENAPGKLSILTPDGKSFVSSPTPIDGTRIMNGEAVTILESCSQGNYYQMLRSGLSVAVTEQYNCTRPQNCAQNVYFWGYMRQSLDSQDFIPETSWAVPVKVPAPGGCGDESSDERIVEVYPALNKVVARTNLRYYIWTYGTFTAVEYTAVAGADLLVATESDVYAYFNSTKRLLKFPDGSDVPEEILTGVDIVQLHGDGTRRIFALYANGTLFVINPVGSLSSAMLVFSTGTVDKTSFIPAGTSIADISAGSGSVAFLLNNGSVVVCWGWIYTSFSKSDDGRCEMQPLPDGIVIGEIVNGGSHVMMLSTDRKRLFISGTNWFGELGDGSSDFDAWDSYNGIYSTRFTEFSAENSSLAGRFMDKIHAKSHANFVVATIAVVPAATPIGFAEISVPFNLTNVPGDVDLLTPEFFIDGSAPIPCTNPISVTRSAKADAAIRRMTCKIADNVLEQAFNNRPDTFLKSVTMYMRVQARQNGNIIERSPWSPVAIVHSSPTLTTCSSSASCPHANMASKSLRLAGTGFGTDPSALVVLVSPLFVKCVVKEAADTMLTCDLESTLPEGPLHVAVFRYSPASNVDQLIRYAVQVKYVFPVPVITPSRVELPVTAPILSISGSSWGTDPESLEVYILTSPIRNCKVFYATETLLKCYTNASLNPLPLTSALPAQVVRAYGPTASDYVASTVPSPAILPSPASLSSRFALNTQSVRIDGTAFGSDVSQLNVTLVLQPARRRSVSATVSIECTPINITATYLTCAPTALFPSSGSVSAVVYRQGAPSGAPAFIGTVIAPSRVTNTLASKTVAANAFIVTISGSGFAPYPYHQENSVAFSSGTCDEVVNATTTEIICKWSGTTFQAPAALKATVTSYGGVSPDGEVSVANIVASPSFTTTAAGYSVPLGASTLTFNGASFNPSVTDTQVFVTYEPPGVDLPTGFVATPCTVQSVTEAQIQCAVPGGSLNKTGNLYAQVISYGGSSKYTAVATVYDPAGAIAGGAIGGILGCVVIASLVVLFMYRRRLAKFQKQKEMLEAQIPKELQPLVNIKSSDIKMMQLLGEGSFGSVYLGEYKGRYCAVKKLSANVISSAVSEFFREASLMLSIKPHRNIVRVFGMCQEMGNFMMLMEFLPRGSLDKLIKTSIPDGSPTPVMEPRVQWRIVRGLAAGMAALAAQNIVHRDLAARNVLLDTNLDSKVADFGFSRVVGQEKEGKTNASVGPVRWMPPESLGKLQYSEKSDVWAFASTLFELFSGREPFEGEDLISVAVAVRDTGRTPMPNLPDNTPKYIRQLMEMCYKFEPKERPTFDEIVQYLDNAVDPEWVASYKREDIAFTDAVSAELGVSTNKKTNKTKKQPIVEPAVQASPPTRPSRNYAELLTNKSNGTNKTSKRDDDKEIELETKTNQTTSKSKDQSTNKSKNSTNRTNRKPAEQELVDGAAPVSQSAGYGTMPRDMQPDEITEVNKTSTKKSSRSPAIDAELSPVSQSGTYGGLPIDNTVEKETPTPKSPGSRSKTPSKERSATPKGDPPAPHSQSGTYGGLPVDQNTTKKAKSPIDRAKSPSTRPKSPVPAADPAAESQSGTYGSLPTTTATTTTTKKPRSPKAESGTSSRRSKPKAAEDEKPPQSQNYGGLPARD